MGPAISLVESRTFWSAIIALTVLVAKAFGLSQLTAWLIDPSLLDNIMSAIAMLASISSIVFRGVAASKVTSILPPAK